MFGVGLFSNGVNLLADETYVNLKIQQRSTDKNTSSMNII